MIEETRRNDCGIMPLKFAIYALHPISYQVPIFQNIQKIIDDKELKIDLTVLYGDDLSLKYVYYDHLRETVKFSTPDILVGYKSLFLKNYSRDPRRGFLSRINFGIVNTIYNENYDVLLIHGYDRLTSLFALFAAKWSKTKIIFRGEAAYNEDSSTSKIKNILKRAYVSGFFRMCDGFFYSCQKNLSYYNMFGAKGKQKFFVPCAVDNEYFLEKKREIAGHEKLIKRELDIPLVNYVILFLSRLTERKNPRDLLVAAEKINHRKLSILWVGDGPLRKSIEEDSKRKGIHSIFVGFRKREELAKYYAISNLFVILSSKDPSPKTLNEAMVFSKPVIATKAVGTAKDLIKNGLNGFIIENGDIIELAKRISYFMDNKGAERRMGKESYKMIEGWTFKKDAEEMIKAVRCIKKK